MLSGMVFKLFSLLFITSLCSAALVSLKTQQGATWWEGKYSGGSDLASMKAAVKQAYEEMADDAKAKKVQRVPGTMGLLWTKSGGMFQSSVKGVAASGHQIVEGCTDNEHRYNGNCAEVWALYEAEQKGWDLDSSLLAVYGVMNAAGGTGFMSPCSDKNGKGCATILKSKKYSDLKVQCVTRNGMTKRQELPTSPVDGESEWEDVEPESEPQLSKRTAVKETTKKKTSTRHKTTSTGIKKTSTGTKKTSTGTKKTSTSHKKSGARTGATKSKSKSKSKGDSTTGGSCSLEGRGVVELVSGKKSTTTTKGTKGTKNSKGTKKAATTKKAGTTA